MIRTARASRDSTAGHRADDEERLGAACHGVGEGSLGRFVREVLLAGVESDEGTAASAVVAADRSPEDGVAGFERIQYGAQRGRTVQPDLHLLTHPGQGAEMRRQHDANHASVWTSTESTGGRSRTIGAQLSPPLAEAYTCPPVVPK